MTAQISAFDKSGSKLSKSQIEDVVGEGFDVKKFVESFEVLAEAEGGIKKLREMVLNLAVRGVLVPQLRGDGNSDTLAADLAARRSKLLSVARVRSDLIPVPSDEHPFPVPSSWRWLRLGHFGGFLGGGTPSKSNTSFWTGNIPWVSPKDMKRPYIDDAEDHISEAAVGSSAVKMIPPRSLLFVLRGMILAHSFPVALTQKKVTINQDMKALVLAVPETDEYLLRTCWAARARVLRRVERSSHGTCRLESEAVEELPIPLPPLAEQKRIVAKVDELMRLLDDLEAKQAKRQDVQTRLRTAALGALTSAAGPEAFETAWKRVACEFGTLFEGVESVRSVRSTILDLAATGRLIAPAPRSASLVRSVLVRAAAAAAPDTEHADPKEWTEERGWLHAPLGALLGEPLANGRSVPDDPNGFPVLRLSALRGRFVDFRERKLGAWTAKEAGPFVVKRGDVLFVRGNGAIRLVGRACMAGEPLESVAFPDTAIRARPHPDLLDASWLWYVWESPSVRRQVEAIAKTTAGIFKVSQDGLYSIRLPAPTLAEQKRIVAKVEQLMKLCDDLEARLKRQETTASRLVRTVVGEMVGE